ncbi:MAG TPA: hypothetical protein VHA33_04620 [Candidatus Angelobacter sp.]|nr:hypothetical protein [Candidatus Angelobacter sp.]
MAERAASKLNVALEQYNRKRRFENTPEPPGKTERGAQNRLVVQKHRATRLHYDFRLEMEGGDGGRIDKLDYSVLTNRNLNEIAGDKNSAEWQSNRKSATQKNEEWLNADVLPKEKPVKKKTGSTAVAKSSRAGEKSFSDAKAISTQLEALAEARRGPMPSVIHPMLATLVEQPFDDDQWLFEVKWDGYRAVTFIQDGKVRLVSRNQNQLTGEFPEIAKAAGALKVENAILDGEVVALDEKPDECTFEFPRSTHDEVKKAEEGSAA